MNGKENGNYYLGFRILGLGYKGKKEYSVLWRGILGHMGVQRVTGVFENHNHGNGYLRWIYKRH